MEDIKTLANKGPSGDWGPHSNAISLIVKGFIELEK